MSGRRGRPATVDQLGMVLDGAPELAMRGTLHRATCHEIRTMINAGDLDEDKMAGTIQAARDLAAAIDRASGLSGRKQDTYALAKMHEVLAALRTELRGAGGLTDVDAAFLAALAGTETT